MKWHVTRVWLRSQTKAAVLCQVGQTYSGVNSFEPSETYFQGRPSYGTLFSFSLGNIPMLNFHFICCQRISIEPTNDIEVQVSNRCSTVTFQLHHDGATVFSHTVLYSEQGLVIRPLHLNPLLFRHLNTILEPEDFGKGLGLEWYFNEGCLPCFHSHWVCS